MDLALLRFFTGLAGHGWDRLIVFCASYLQYLLGAAVVLYTFVPHRRLRLFAAAFGSAILARLVAAPLIQLFVQRPRPFVSLPDMTPLISVYQWEYVRSMPSGHALFFFALAAASYRFDRNLGRLLFVGAAIIGIARIIAGVHWPSDILAGALIGSAVGWAVARYIPAFRNA